jgi:hypothetical protein
MSEVPTTPSPDQPLIVPDEPTVPADPTPGRAIPADPAEAPEPTQPIDPPEPTPDPHQPEPQP